jgi:putative ABC transport system substrate-binding protein
MDRRAFLGSLAGLFAAPLAAEAQPTGKVWRIGVLGAPSTANMVGPDPKNEFPRALVRGLRELGNVYGQHFVTEPRGAEGKRDRYPALVGELIDLKVDVIVAVAASLSAVKQATSTIPIVFPGAPEPVGQGYAQSLARPGGNLTGLSYQTFELVGKRLELLKQLVPTRAPVAILLDRADVKTWPALQAAARGRGWKLLSFPIQDPSGDQPQDRQDPRPDDPGVAPAAGGSGDRVMDRRLHRHFSGSLRVKGIERGRLN